MFRGRPVRERRQLPTFVGEHPAQARCLRQHSARPVKGVNRGKGSDQRLELQLPAWLTPSLIHGDSGGVLFIGTEDKILVNRGKFEATPASLGEAPLPANAIRLYNSYSHTKNFLDCMRSRKKPICDVEIGCRSATVCHLGNIAYWHHRHLYWDPVTERFLRDEEANQWLDRPKRAPWQV